MLGHKDIALGLEGRGSYVWPEVDFVTRELHENVLKAAPPPGIAP